MKLSISLLQLGVAAWLGVFVPGLGAEESHHAHVQHQVHEHGNAHLNLALERHVLMLELRMSAMDVLGFEHTPHDDTKKAQLAKAQQQLAQTEHVVLAGHDGQDEHHDHDEHHGQGHAHDKHDEPTQEGSEKNHSEFLGRCTFHCAKPDALKGIELQLFTRYPRPEKIQVRAVTAHGQTVTYLTPSQTRITLP